MTLATGFFDGFLLAPSLAKNCCASATLSSEQRFLLSPDVGSGLATSLIVADCLFSQADPEFLAFDWIWSDLDETPE